ncbi:hypothetical protein NY406_04245 [Chlorobaculum sp. MV4-Y]|uniref:hypothetical protein n=1 Tax=Chlorobaculum sp. MV4-Y TaxID=2976335 RepID=UPI0021B04E02|nr:hypothetical protein [Chlorobaculum sp. MV4-Y]UWX58481.1 hypothetical protein NY406_04245 [Chlorobaculum sp. MV4-Y]
MDAGIEQDHPDHLHQLFEVVNQKANLAAFQDNLPLPEFGIVFDLAFQCGQVLVVGDAKISAGEVVVEL